MTIREAIERADTLRPNMISDTEKRLWLAQLDGAVRKQIHQRHENAAENIAVGADREQKDGTVLLVGEPYTSVYLYWLMAQADLALGELHRYNNDMMLYNMALTEYAVDYKREHLPLKQGQFLF